MTPAEHVCTETNGPEWHAGRGRTYRGHTDRGARARQPRVRTPHPGALASGPASKASAAPAKRGGFESVSPPSLALPGPRGPPATPRPAVARTCRPHEARQQPPQSGPRAGPTRCVHARRETCGPFGAPKNYNSQKAPRCAHTATEAPRAGVTETTTPRRPSVCTLWKEDSQPASPGARGGRGRQMGAGLRFLKEGRSPQSLKRLRTREAKSVTPGHTALWFACHSSPLSSGSHLSQMIAVVPAENRESGKLADVGK